MAATGSVVGFAEPGRLFAPDESPPDIQGLPPLVRCIASSFDATASGLGVAFAILRPALQLKRDA